MPAHPPAHTAVFQHFTFPCLGHLGAYLDSRGDPYDWWVYSETDAAVAEQVAGADRLILLGSPDSVNDDAAWVGAVRRIVQRHLAAGKPVLGICFGAQMIASALGAEVARLDQPRLGFRQLGQPNEGAAAGNWLCFHEEHVPLVSPMMPLLIDSGILYAFRHGSALGLQFHPEMDRAAIQNIADALGKDDPLHANLIAAIENFDESSMERSFNLFDSVFSEIMT